MNSQQELLDAINTISQNRDKSCDTPATVLRVEGDTVWVHIDGGADETPVQKTINCSEGETVQVRISNGSAFLVGNASAPPTDDTTANVAHFVAEQADEKAEEAITSVNAIRQTVEEKVDSGDSNISTLSSTMYQDAYGVNIFNDDLAVGDSYAHIDGDSFDIKQVTTAGTIDNTNDVPLASFGANQVDIGYIDATDGGYQLTIKSTGIDLREVTSWPAESTSGWHFDLEKIMYSGTGAVSWPTAIFANTYLQFMAANVVQFVPMTTVGQGTASFKKTQVDSLSSVYTEMSVDGGVVTLEQVSPIVYPVNNKTVLKPGYIQISEELQDLDGNNLLDEWVGTTTVSSGSFSFSGLNDDYIYSRPYIYVDDSSTEFNPTAQIYSIGGTPSNRTITWTTNADNGASVKLRRIK